MEYKLNKIDIETRNRINETTSSEKIHRRSDILVDKEKQNNKEFKEKQESNYKKFVIEAVKSNNIEVPAYKDVKENLSPNSQKGVLVDIKK